jgi:excisionase family DNA binding protein
MPLLSVKQVAELTHLSELTVRKRIESGELPAVRMGKDGPIRVSKLALAELMVPARKDKAEA